MPSNKLISVLEERVVTRKNLVQFGVQELKEFCKARSIKVFPSGKRGPVKRDFIEGLLSLVGNQA